jgi:glucose/arabinose dehydrogenase
MAKRARAAHLPAMTLARRALLATPALVAPFVIPSVAAPARGQGSVVQTGRGPLMLTVLAEGLERPWGGGFLPDGRLLVSERPGRARLVAPDGRLGPPLAGLPAIEPGGQGGLLDLQPAPDFARTQEVFFVSSALVQGGALTRLSRARLTPQGLADAQPVLDCTPAQSSGRMHYGGRLAFSPDGRHVFLTSGDRNNDRARAQRLDDLAGKIIRLTRSGHLPPDNPFVGRAGARGEIWSYGHRNPQGIAFHPATGSLLAAEFGPRGGDELNIIRPGANYGWPEATHGREYWGGSIAGGRSTGPGFADPLKQWTPSISPSGIGFWRGDLWLACLNPPGLLRLEMTGDRPGAEERLLWGQARLRQVIPAPDGALLLLTDEAQGRVLRLAPA